MVTNKTTSVIATAFIRAPPIELNENKQKLPLTEGFKAIIVARVPLIS